LFETNGIITTNTDRDVFKFNLKQRSNITLHALPFSVGDNNEGANLDVKLVLLNEAMEVVGDYDPEEVLNVTVDTVLNRGEYYVIIMGAGNQNTTNYGSLGSYSFYGVLSPATVLPIRQVDLQGRADKDAHRFSWKVITDVPAEKIILEKSEDGTNYVELET